MPIASKTIKITGKRVLVTISDRDSQTKSRHPIFLPKSSPIYNGQNRFERAERTVSRFARRVNFQRGKLWERNYEFFVSDLSPENGRHDGIQS